MSISLKSVIEGVRGIRELQQMELPAPLAFKLSRVAREIDTVLQDYQNSRNVILDKYAEIGDIGPGALVGEESPEVVAKRNEMIASRNDDMNDLLEVHVDITSPGLHIDDFGVLPIKPYILSDLQTLGLI
jgi:hypothetical protein